MKTRPEKGAQRVSPEDAALDALALVNLAWMSLEPIEREQTPASLRDALNHLVMMALP